MATSWFHPRSDSLCSVPICGHRRYSKKPEQWRSKESTKQSTHKAFSELFSSVADPEHAENREVTNTPQDVEEEREPTGSKGSQGQKQKKVLPQDMDLDLEGPMAQLGFSFAITKSKNKKSAKPSEAIVPLGAKDSSKDDLISSIGQVEEKAGKKGKEARSQAGFDDIDRLFDRKKVDKKDKKGKKRKHSAEGGTAEPSQSVAGMVDEKLEDPSLKGVMGALETKSKKKKMKSGVNDPENVDLSEQKKKKKQLVMM